MIRQVAPILVDETRVRPIRPSLERQAIRAAKHDSIHAGACASERIACIGEVGGIHEPMKGRPVILDTCLEIRVTSNDNGTALRVPLDVRSKLLKAAPASLDIVLAVSGLGMYIINVYGDMMAQASPRDGEPFLTEAIAGVAEVSMTSTPPNPLRPLQREDR